MKSAESGAPLPMWAARALVALAGCAVIALIWSLAEQNRLLKQALLSGEAVTQARTPAVGDQLPDVGLVSDDGEERRLSELLGGGAVVAFLTTTCPYCQATIPQWTALSNELAASGIKFVAVSLHGAEPSATYAIEHNIPWRVWTLADPADRSALGVNAVPVTLFVLPNSRVEALWRGVLTESDVARIGEAAHK